MRGSSKKMQTHFTDRQLHDKKTAEADAILRTCVHCGLCTATCPTYVLLGDERDSPRGRIYLIKDMFESGRPASPEIQHHLDRCLSCLSCMSTCPSGVDYMHLADLARQHVEQTGKRSLKSRFLRAFVAKTLPYPGRARFAIWLSYLALPLRNMFQKIGLKELSAMLDLLPSTPTIRGKYRGGGVARPHFTREKRVALMTGCVQQVLRPQINDATVRVLARQAVEVNISAKAGCCGALALHMGREAEAIAAAKQNVDAWHTLMREEALDAIIINASGCGTTVKDYGHLLADEPGYASRAKEVADLAVDISEFMDNFNYDAPRNWTAIRVAYHAACSLQHGQKVKEEPLRLLYQAGYSVVEVPEGHLCCGSAGTYNIMQPELAAQLRDRKVQNIASVKPDVIATGNIGCITQLSSATDIPVVHTVELLDWALGGPCPSELNHLKERTRNISDYIQEAAE